MTTALGADIERIRDFSTNTWEAFLTPAEKKNIAKAPSAKRNYLRTLSWSLKESVLKALGVGLRMHPRHVDVSRVINKKKESHIIEINGVLHSAEVQYWHIDHDFIVTVVVFPHFSGYDWSDNQVWNYGTPSLKSYRKR